MTRESDLIIEIMLIVQERVKQDDGTFVPMLVESLIKLDYNTGEWKKLQHLRRIDQTGQQNDTKKITSQNSVVI